MDDECKKLKENQDYLKNKRKEENKKKSILAYYLEKNYSDNSERSSSTKLWFLKQERWYEWFIL